ncbi:thiol:disulfide interchange protein DsbA/DsbL [Leeia oryzae]|uniref:thiol:disulfide interchange protein DsbA/DsbL n=1 Tax=Leeia oryzae TaxID=356662 RepID=UPI0003804909|nr:thiol:disulfide interchange protein DsbA/DsbL [Leeia oryzae]
MQRWFKRLLLGAAVLLGASVAQAAQWQALPKPMPVQTPGKVEVIEFFWYGCPHCYHLEPSLETWVKKLPADVQFRRIHAAWNSGMQVHAQLYATVQTLKLDDKLNMPIFNAIHKDNVELRDESVLNDWIAKQPGINAKNFMKTYKSFSSQTYARLSPQYTRDYGINAVPTFVVGGKYMTSVADAGSEADLYKVLEQLIAKVRNKQ